LFTTAFVEFPGQPIEQEADIESTFPRLLIREKLSPSFGAIGACEGFRFAGLAAAAKAVQACILYCCGL
jgi:hypothetical protein